jgi:peptidoglycan/xylan/chitin deacetylase (PgdA/CDA1 family)
VAAEIPVEQPTSAPGPLAAPTRHGAGTRPSRLRAAALLVHRAGLSGTFRRAANRLRLRLDAGGRPTPPFLSWDAARRLQILIYHRVNDERDPYFPATPVAVFASQMEHLARTHRVLPLDAAVAGLARGDLPRNAAAITFDDGYRDNLHHAFPILRRLGLPATLYLATGAIGTGRVLWHDRVFVAFRETRAPRMEGVLPGDHAWPLRTVEERLHAQRATLAHLRSLAEADRDRVIERLSASLGVAPVAGAPSLMLDWDEVRTMHRGGIAMGSHTVTHPILSKLPADRGREELLESKRAIERAIGAPVTGLAYPNGSPSDFDDATKTLLRESGYEYAVTTIPGANRGGTDPHELRRGTPWDEDLCTFAFRLDYNKMRI